jgi:hypothetical protein
MVGVMAEREGFDLSDFRKYVHSLTTSNPAPTAFFPFENYGVNSPGQIIIIMLQLF